MNAFKDSKGGYSQPTRKAEMKKARVRKNTGPIITMKPKNRVKDVRAEHRTKQHSEVAKYLNE